MRRIAFILLGFMLSFFAATVFAQKSNQQYIDSLIIVLQKSKEDTNKINSLFNYVSALRDANPDSAFSLSLEALRLSEKLNWLPGIGESYHHIATIYGMKGNYPNALQNFSKSIDIWEKLEKNVPENRKAGIRDQESKSLGNIGMVYWHQGEFNKALDYDFKALNIDTLTHNKKSIALHLGNIGNVYKSLGNFSSALEYEFKAIKLDEEIDNKKGIATILGNIGSIYASLKKYPEAEKYMLQSIDISHEEADLYGVMEVSNNLSDLYSHNGEDKKALEYYKKAAAAKDSLFNEQKAQEINNKEIKYEFEKKEAVEKALQVKKEADAKRTRNLQYTVIIAFILLAVFLFRNNRHKQKVNKALGKALSDLKSAQTQLIHAEKMASLGELTAGIAHEIENPLNFVNNFSELNKELTEEMVEAANKGNTEELKAIAKNIHDNQEKINYHGKRADGIVKAMLQHSRIGSGQKESTDINALCDKYSKLSQHGARAKDKSFNAILKTDFDQSIGNVNVISQDLGRVVVNLINNAFYAVSLKQKTANASYEPIVTISTKEINNKIEIRIKDNGSGIPSAIKEKIFQPFFTTKPTGSGTGLGLSLSYDIVKAHGGELKVETKEGEFAEFIITL